MDNLRKRCENLYWDMHQGYYSHGEVTKLFDLIESFAREIRNETLHDAVRAVTTIPEGVTADHAVTLMRAAERIAKLKGVAALAARVSERKK